MAVIDFKGFFQRKRSLKDITVDELRREKIRLEHEESRLAGQVEELERSKQQVFLRGKDESSERQQRILATKIKELDVQAGSMDRNLRFISKQLRIVNGFIQIKENQRLIQEAGLASIISSIDMEKLQQYVEQASVEGSFQWDKFESILGNLEDTEKITGGGEEDTGQAGHDPAQGKARERAVSSAAAPAWLLHPAGRAAACSPGR
jgi:FtsZ-binding cell division protein ZapB